MTRALVFVLCFTPGCALLDALAGEGAKGPAQTPEDTGDEGEGAGEGEGEGEVACEDGAQLAARAIAVGFDRSCALRCDGEITCWGAGSLAPPAGPYVDVTVGQRFACGRRADGTVACFGEQGISLPESYSAVSAGQGFACGLDETASLQCDGDMSYPSFTLPAGQFSTLAAGWAYVCAERLDSGALVCGGTFSAPQPPAADLREVRVGADFACGLDAGGEIACFNADGTLAGPAGAFSELGVGDGTACAVSSADASLTCWTETDEGAAILEGTPVGRFSSVAVATGHACAVRENHTVVCWGSDYLGRTAVPPP